MKSFRRCKKGLWERVKITVKIYLNLKMAEILKKNNGFNKFEEKKFKNLNF